MTLKVSQQDNISLFESVDSNASTCSTHTNLSRSVELTLAPLIEKLVSAQGSEGVVSGSRPKAQIGRPVSVLLQALDQSVSHLTQVAEEIAYEVEGKNQSRMLSAVHRLKGSARQLKERLVSSGDGTSVREVARALLYDVASVLSVADKLDVRRLVEVGQSVESWLERLKDVISAQELYQHIRDFTPVMGRLTKLAKNRQEELDCCQENSCLVESLSWYRRELAIGCSLLIPSCKCYVRHPDIQTTRSIRDFAFEVILNAANYMSRIAKESFVPPSFILERAGELHQQIHSVRLQQMLPPDEAQSSLTVEARQLITELIQRTDSIAELVSTRDMHKQRLMEFSTQAQSILDSDLTGEQTTEDLDRLCDDLCHAANLSNLDALLELHTLLREPLLEMQTAARSGDLPQLEEAIDSFFQLMERILQVSENISASCSDPGSTRLITLTSQQLTCLASQLTNAARSYSQRPRSRAAWRCLLCISELWEQELALLLDSQDSVMPLADFLAVSQLHISEHSASSIKAIEKCDLAALVTHRDGIRSTCSRLLCIVEGCMTEGEIELELEIQHGVFSLLSALRGELFKFDQEMNQIELFLLNSPQSSYQGASSYKQVSHRICELVLDIKHTLLELLEKGGNVLCESLERNSQLGLNVSYENKNDLRSCSYRQMSRSRSSAFDQAEREVQDILNSLSPPEKFRLESAQQEFQVQQIRLESAVAKWDETENDVIFLAKDMCVMMMDISDFTKGEGPIHTPNDLIETASKLTSSSQYLADLISRIIEHCHDSNSIGDLQAYLSELKLYSHQIKMTSKVYADLSQVRLNSDNISSIVISSKNLLNSVVKLVMASYIACNMIAKSAENHGHQLRLIKWKMRPPSKKPLCRTTSAYSISSSTSHMSRSGTGRRSSSRPGKTPLHMMDEFEADEERIAFV